MFFWGGDFTFKPLPKPSLTLALQSYKISKFSTNSAFLLMADFFPQIYLGVNSGHM